MWYSLKYTDKMPEGRAGYAKFWFIRIRPRYVSDVGIHAHEMKHVRQFWRNPFKHCFFYGRDHEYTLDCEVEAYKEQLKHQPNDRNYREMYAIFIATRYGLKIPFEKAYGLLED